MSLKTQTMNALTINELLCNSPRADTIMSLLVHLRNGGDIWYGTTADTNTWVRSTDNSDFSQILNAIINGYATRHLFVSYNTGDISEIVYKYHINDKLRPISRCHLSNFTNTYNIVTNDMIQYFYGGVAVEEEQLRIVIIVQHQRTPLVCDEVILKSIKYCTPESVFTTFYVERLNEPFGKRG